MLVPGQKLGDWKPKFLEQALGMKVQVVGPTPNNLARLAKMFGHLQTLGAQGRTKFLEQALGVKAQVVGPTT